MSEPKSGVGVEGVEGVERTVVEARGALERGEWLSRYAASQPACAGSCPSVPERSIVTVPTMTVPVVTVPASTYVIDMPGWRVIARRAGTTVLLVSLLPMCVFYGTMSAFGLRAAVLVTVGWYYAGLLLNVVRHKPVLAAALLGAGLLSIRAVVMFATGSAFVYFLQPVAGTVATATVFAVTALAGRPVLDRIAHEFCPFPEDLSVRLRKARFFCRLSFVWSITYFFNAAATVWLLTSSSVTGFILLKSVLSPVVTILALLASYLVFRVAVRHEDVSIRWGGAATS